MKKRWLQSLEHTEPQYLDEADPYLAKSKVTKKRNRIITSAVALAASLAIVVSSLVLFIPYNNQMPDVSAYAGSEYYELIQNINALTYQPPKYKNNFDKLTSNVKNSFLAGSMGSDNGPMGGGAGAPGDAEGGSGRVDVTDNQVAGVQEADLIARTATHIFYLRGRTLYAYAIAGENTTEVGQITCSFEMDYSPYQTGTEFYLSDDGKTATLLFTGSDNKGKGSMALISLDVSDPAQMEQKGQFMLSGGYISSRLTDGKLLLVSEYLIRGKVDYDNPETYLPTVTQDGQKTPLPMADIIMPENPTSLRYTVVTLLDAADLSLQQAKAAFSYTDDIYVNHDRIYLAYVYAAYADAEDAEYTVRNSMTDILCLSAEDLTTCGKTTVRGYIKDQYSLDEYEGVLRVVTTTNETTVSQSYTNRENGALSDVAGGWDMISASILQTATGRSNASLYCIDIDTWETVAKVENFAPDYEEVRSVRFDGTAAYVCTAIEVSDPVFFFDLSDLANITYKDTGTVEGFSTSLINLGDGFLLGIGQSDWSDMKVEVYEESALGVRSVAVWEKQNAGYSTEYKSYYIDRESDHFGFGITVYDSITGEKVSKYVLLHFDGYALAEVAVLPLHKNADLALCRGVIIDGYLYVFDQYTFAVGKIS